MNQNGDRLAGSETEHFRQLFKSSLDLYGMTAADIADHECAYAPDPIARREFEAISMAFLPCACKSIKKPGKPLRNSVKSAVQNALYREQPPLHTRAYALISLLMRSQKRGDWLRTHPRQSDPLREAYARSRDDASLRFLRAPANANTCEPPERFPEVALTPHGVERLAVVLTDELSRRTMIRHAKDDVCNAIAGILRDMHDECNAAFVQRIRRADKFRRVDMVKESVRIESGIVREKSSFQTTNNTIYMVRDRLRDQRPEGATDADTFGWLSAMLVDQWCSFGEFSPEKLLGSGAGRVLRRES